MTWKLGLYRLRESVHNPNPQDTAPLGSLTRVKFWRKGVQFRIYPSAKIENRLYLGSLSNRYPFVIDGPVDYAPPQVLLDALEFVEPTCVREVYNSLYHRVSERQVLQSLVDLGRTTLTEVRALASTGPKGEKEHD